jgi:superfamily I DNA/RNA helicase
LLLHSVNDRVAGPDLDALEDAGVPVRHVAAGSGDDVATDGFADRALVTTIHQAKGREWPVVAVGGLDHPGRHDDPVGAHLSRYCPHDPFEPAERIAAFDRARVYYVAFSRPSGLLALSATGRPHRSFDAIWDGLPRWPDIDHAGLGAQRFSDAYPAVARVTAPDLVINIDRMESLTVRLRM